MRTQAVLFDLDGVLADVDYRRAAAFFEPLLAMPLSELGICLQRWITAHQDTLEHGIWSRFWDDLADERRLAAEARRALHGFDYRSIYSPFPDARAALSCAKASGCSTGVLSNTPLVDLPDLLVYLGLSDAIDCVVFPQANGVAKPAPAAYQRALALLEVDPQACLFLDDEPLNVEAASALGLRAIQVDRRRAAGEALPPNHIRTLDELPKLLVATDSAISLGIQRA